MHEQSLGWSDGEGWEEDAFEEWGFDSGITEHLLFVYSLIYIKEEIQQ